MRNSKRKTQKERKWAKERRGVVVVEENGRSNFPITPACKKKIKLIHSSSASQIQSDLFLSPPPPQIHLLRKKEQERNPAYKRKGGGERKNRKKNNCPITLASKK